MNDSGRQHCIDDRQSLRHYLLQHSEQYSEAVAPHRHENERGTLRTAGYIRHATRTEMCSEGGQRYQYSLPRSAQLATS